MPLLLAFHREFILLLDDKLYFVYLLLCLFINYISIQHLVRLRWEELSPSERRNFANLSVDLMSEIADPCEEWPLKSQTAALVAEVLVMILLISFTLLLILL